MINIQWKKECKRIRTWVRQDKVRCGLKKMPRCELFMQYLQCHKQLHFVVLNIYNMQSQTIQTVNMKSRWKKRKPHKEAEIKVKPQNTNLFKTIPWGPALERLDASIFLSGFCHLTPWKTSERLSSLGWPSVGAMEPLFNSGRMFPLLWLENSAAFSIISSMCVRLSHRKLHDGECLVLYAETSTEATDGSGLCLAAMQQLAPILIVEINQCPLLSWLIYNQIFRIHPCDENLDITNSIFTLPRWNCKTMTDFKEMKKHGTF